MSVIDLVTDNVESALAPLKGACADDDLTDIMVCRHDLVWIRKGNENHSTGIQFPSESALVTAIEQLGNRMGISVTADAPILQARGSLFGRACRFNAGIRPYAVNGANLTIRFHKDTTLTLDEVVKSGAFDESKAAMLRQCVSERRATMFVGEMGSGKTTTMKALVMAYPKPHRVVTIEDAQELILEPDRNWVAAEVGEFERGQISLEKAISNALRQMASVVLIGEANSEAMGMAYLHSLRLGCKGTSGTMHAADLDMAIQTLYLWARGNKAEHLLGYLDGMFMMAPNPEGAGVRCIDARLSCGADALSQLVRSQG